MESKLGRQTECLGVRGKFQSWWRGPWGLGVHGQFWSMGGGMGAGAEATGLKFEANLGYAVFSKTAQVIL